MRGRGRIKLNMERIVEEHDNGNNKEKSQRRRKRNIGGNYFYDVTFEGRRTTPHAQLLSASIRAYREKVEEN